MAKAVQRSGDWLRCRPGCSQCCVGVFAIDRLDEERLRNGLAELRQREPERAERVIDRARTAAARLKPEFPGDPETGVLDESEGGLEQFDEYANEEPCPALDPGTGTCDLYESRPVTCRIFGPPMRLGDEAFGVCELCFVGASDKEIAACEVEIPVETDAGAPHTIVAFALLHTF